MLGGTVFLGRAVVKEALSGGHEVTVFHRGRSGGRATGEVPERVEEVLGDRESAADLARLSGDFDLVVDTCGYLPTVVARSAAALTDRVGRYAFVSSVNAFVRWPEAADWWRHEEYDGPADAGPDDARAAELDPGQLYGWRKVGCERAVATALGADRTVVVRPGCIVGPYDGVVGRLPWWIDRVARGGETLVPGRPGDEVGLVDARDLARFLLGAPAGMHVAAGPGGRDDRAGLLAACAAATGGAVEATYVDDEAWLADRVQPWTEVPLWVPRAEAPGVFTTDDAPARAGGMTWRPLAETVADTWAWMRSVPGGWQPSAATPGLAPDREAELLAAWHAR